MVFHRFDRQILVATESTEGTAETIAVGDFVECLEDVSYTLTPFTLERPLVRPSFTKIPDYYASTGITSSDTVVTQVDFTFTVEMTAATGGPTTSAPGYDALLVACGMERIDSVLRDTISGGTVNNGPIFHYERTTDTTNQDSVSTHFTGDSTYYYTGAAPSSGSVTATFGTPATMTTTTAGTATGVAYGFSIDAADGDNSSATIEFGMDGRRVTVKGCRGNCSIQFTAMDRVLMTFTMMGILHNISDSSANRTGISYAHQLPPTFVGAGLTLMEAAGSTNHTGALFQAMTLDFGNDMVMREDANSASGWKAARIIDRNPTITVNPDAIAGGATSSTIYDYFEAFAEGTPTRMSWQVGDQHDGNSFLFKCPALQWTGVADGERDNYTVYDCSAKLTGGTNGDSVVHSATTTRYYDDKGADNELVIIMS